MIRHFQQLKRKLVKHIWVLAAGLIFLGTTLVAPTLYANMAYKNQRYNLEGKRPIPAKDVAIVLGAGVFPDGTPTPYLRNRLTTAAEMYKKGTVKRIIVSGDNSTKKYDEPTAMKRYLLQIGVPEQDITLDYAGFNTYDTCYRAKHVFGVTNAIVVTQGYHLPRAVMTCHSLAIDVIGVAAIRPARDYTAAYIAREYVSTAKAAVQLVFKPKPTVL